MKQLICILSIFLLALTVGSIDSIAQDSASEDYFLGEWEFTIDGTEAGTLNMVLSIEKEEDEFSGTMGDPTLGFQFQLSSFSTTDSGLSATASLQAPAMEIPVKLIKRDESSATVDMDGSTFTATRQEE